MRNYVKCDNAELTSILKKCPNVLRLQLEETLDFKFDFFKKLGVPMHKHKDIVVRDPAILTRTIESMEENVLFLLETGWDTENIPSFVYKHPKILRYVDQNERAHKTRTLHLPTFLSFPFADTHHTPFLSPLSSLVFSLSFLSMHCA